MKPVDVMGMRFGRLVAVEVLTAKQTGKRRAWRCKCDCGNEVLVGATSLTTGNTQSCGCLRRELHSRKLTKDGMSESPEKMAWYGMIARCHKPHSRAFKHYGARGISVCDRWRESFLNFYEDMGPRPSAHHSIDRINNDGNYEPGNCRWATKVQQCLNRRDTALLTVGGVTKPLQEWADQAVVTKSGLRDRLKRGMSPEEALYAPRFKRTRQAQQEST